MLYTTTMHSCIVGHVCIDKNRSENVSYTAPGGPAIFIEKVFSQIPDLTTTIITPYGDDFLPLTQQLPLYPQKPTAKETLVYENTTTREGRIQRAYKRDMALTIPLDTHLKKLLQACDMLFFAPLLPISPEYIRDVVSHTNPRALKLLLPQGYYRQFSKDNAVMVREFIEAPHILPLVDVVVVSQEDAPNMQHIAKDWSKKYHVLSIVTLGEKGAVAMKQGKEVLLSTHPVPAEKIVDSIGSGDIFSACFGYAYKKTHNIEKSGAYANAIARACLFSPSHMLQIDKLLLSLSSLII